MQGLPWWYSGKESACQYKRCERHSFDPSVRKILWSGQWKPTPIFLLGKFHGQRSQVGYSPGDWKELETTEPTHTIMSVIEHLFMCLFVICTVFFAEMFVLVFCPFFWVGCLFCWYWTVWAAYVFWILILFQLLCLQLISPILRAIFSSCLLFPLVCKSF